MKINIKFSYFQHLRYDVTITYLIIAMIFCKTMHQPLNVSDPEKTSIVVKKILPSYGAAVV